MLGPADLVRQFDDLRVVVVGDALVDRYRWGHSAGVCREGPVARVLVEGRHDVPGGAGNTAANVAALGARPSLIGVRGPDPDGAQLEHTLRQLGVDPRLVEDRARATIVKHRVLADGQLVARFDEGLPQVVDERIERALIEALQDAWPASDAVIVADYGQGVCSPGVVDALARLQALEPRPLVVDARAPKRWAQVGALAVKPNAEEASLLLGESLAPGAGRVGKVCERGDELLHAAGVHIVTVTLDVDGVVLLERGRSPYVVAAQPSPPRRAAGAGDTFTAALALALASGSDGPMAAEVASTAAGVAVEKPFTAVCEGEELRLRLRGDDKRLRDGAALREAVEEHRRRGGRIVFTNGCFDLLHRGHVSYLNRAKLLGEVLIVAVNDDGSVSRLKGPQRPVQPLEDRLEVIAALGCVDYVIPFHEDSPAGLIEAARPDVYAKGGDYTNQILPEADLVESLGGRVQLLPYVEDRSTTRIVATIRERLEVPTS